VVAVVVPSALVKHGFVVRGRHAPYHSTPGRLADLPGGIAATELPNATKNCRETLILYVLLLLLVAIGVSSSELIIIYFVSFLSPSFGIALEIVLQKFSGGTFQLGIALEIVYISSRSSTLLFTSMLMFPFLFFRSSTRPFLLLVSRQNFVLLFLPRYQHDLPRLS
jgi:hypothetical protein